jgi:hypothetical protein
MGGNRMAAPRSAKHYSSNDDTMLDQDMTGDDIVTILSELHFAKARPMHLIGIDQQVRDYLVSALSALRRRTESARH